MISYLEALTKINQIAQPLTTQVLPLLESLNRVSAETITAREAIPSFDNSAMDGFAIRAEETQQASLETPLCLPILSSIAAGDPSTPVHYSAQSAVEIMTGAVVPATYNTVLRQEDALIQIDAHNQQIITLHKPVAHNENIRYAGEDFSMGSPIVSAGEVITPQHLMALAATGIGHVRVKRQPRVCVITTGKELIDDCSTPLTQGKIRNSNRVYLRAIFATLGITVDNYATVPDERDIFIAKIKDWMSANDKPDIIITTGAVSVGKWDFVPAALSELGANMVFHKVAVRPGKPILFATLDNTCIIGLPGNPISMAIGFRFFIYPLLCHLQQAAVEKPLIAQLQADITKPAALRCFYKAKLHIEQGSVQVNILKGQESFKISPLLIANCWAILEENRDSYQASELIKIYPLQPRYHLASGQYE